MLTVHKSALSQSDEGGAAVDPEVGDSIDLGGIKAKIHSVTGEKYGLEITEVNGQRVYEGTPDEIEEDEGEDAKAEEAGVDISDKKAARKLLAAARSEDKKAGFAD